jgi:hypothetical protein
MRRWAAVLVPLWLVACGTSTGSSGDGGGAGTHSGSGGSGVSPSGAAGGSSGAAGSAGTGGSRAGTAGGRGAIGGTGGLGAAGRASGGTGGATTGAGGSRGGQAGQAGKGGSTGAGGGAGTGGKAGGGAGAGGNAGNAGNAGTKGTTDAGVGVDAASLPGTNNPVLAGLNADPQVALFDDTFYIYPTTDGFSGWDSTSFSVFSSPNLVQWTNRGVILDLPSDLTWATGHAWAPGIARVGATYYLYFCGDSQIGVATSTSPTGPFKDALGHPLITTTQFGTHSIDPNLFIDDDGTAYLYFGSGSSGLRVVKLNADMISLAGTPTNISPSGASGTLEGSAMFKRNGSYYLQWSEGDTLDANYQVAYARAQSPVGPFTRLGVILQENAGLGILGPGGSTVLAIPGRDEYYMVYHRFKIPGGDGTHREVCIDRMSFNSDGTVVPVTPTLQGLQTAVAP